jgi:hypothetical protein
MVTSTGQAVFAVVAKDGATKTLNGVGKSFGSLKRNGITALKGIAAGAAIAASAIAAFTTIAVKGAISEEKSIILTNAALRQRGFDLDALGPKVEAQVKAFERFGLEGENVRAGIEAGSRFFKNQENLLRANAVAANIAAVTDQDLATVMGILGKAVQGQTRGLKTLGIQVEEGAKLKDILAAADAKYAGIADELANSTGGKMLAAQEKFNGAMDEFGLKILPLVNEALDFITTKALPVFQDLMEDLGPIVGNLVDNFVRPLVDSFAELFKLFESSDGSFSILKAVLLPLEAALTAIKIVIDAIVAGLKFIGVGGGLKTQRLDAAAAAGGFDGSSFVRGAPMTGGGGTSPYLQNNIELSIGTQKQDKLVSDSLIRQGTGRRGGY